MIIPIFQNFLKYRICVDISQGNFDERWIEDDRRGRLKKQGAPGTVGRLLEIGVKHAVWILIAMLTGGAFALYFADAPTLLVELATGNASVLSHAWVGILTSTTYTLAGFAREQVCTWICPWPRLQGAISDPEALTVNYRDYRGEPRGSPKKAAELRAKGEPAGNCVDCLHCVTVCPIGIDIREGPNFACINCGLCGDACDGVMTKLGRPRGLIDYEAWTNIERGHRKEPPRRRVVRPKTITIDLSIAALAGLMGICLSMRSDAKITVIHDHNPVAVRLSDGRIRNGYTVRLYNKADGEQDSRLEMTQLREASVEVIGDDTTMSVAPDTTRELRVLVSASPMSDKPSRSPRRTEISEQAVSVSCRVEGPFIPMAECDAVILVRYRKQKELREFNARMAAYDR